MTTGRFWVETLCNFLHFSVSEKRVSVGIAFYLGLICSLPRAGCEGPGLALAPLVTACNSAHLLGLVSCLNPED